LAAIETDPGRSETCHKTPSNQPTKVARHGAIAPAVFYIYLLDIFNQSSLEG
jgi:hypothetical protein